MKTNILFLSAIMLSGICIYGQLDEQFGNSGRVETFLDTSLIYVHDVVVAPDGKIILAGNKDYAEYCDNLIICYNPDGSIDRSFGDEGFVITDFSSANDMAKSIIMQRDGKILTGGHAWDYFTMARYLPDGSLDPSFGTNGKVMTNTNSMSSYNDAEIILLADNKILLAGSYGYTGCMLQYNNDGSPDETFGDNGYVDVDFGNLGDEYFDIHVALTNGGKILLGAFSWTESYDFTLLRYNPDGTPDVTFGNSGKVTIDIYNNSDNRMSDMILQPDGKILITGSAWDMGNNKYYFVVRCNADGSLDNSFGSDGVAGITLESGWEGRARSILLQPDNKIVVSGYIHSLNESDFALIRYDENGQVDSSFGQNGMVITDFLGSYDYASASVLQRDGKIIVAGSRDFQTIVLARYLSGLDVNYIYYTDVTVTAQEDHSLNIYPNPADRMVHMNYTLAADAFISASLLNAAGETVITFLTGEKRNAGDHSEILLINTDLPRGNYFFRLTINGSNSVKHLLKL